METGREQGYNHDPQATIVGGYQQVVFRAVEYSYPTEVPSMPESGSRRFGEREA
jgi:hypothetical protein